MNRRSEKSGKPWIPERLPRLERTTLRVAPLDLVDAEDRAGWRRRPPRERLEALEIMRQVAYNYDLVTTRFQRILTDPEPLGS